MIDFIYIQNILYENSALEFWIYTHVYIVNDILRKFKCVFIWSPMEEFKKKEKYFQCQHVNRYNIYIIYNIIDINI